MEENSPGMRAVASTYAARLAAIISTFLLVPIVASAVGLEAFGLYALVSTVGVLLAQDLGMASATTRFAARALERDNREELRSIAAASSVYFLTLGLALSGLFLLTLYLLRIRVETPSTIDYWCLVALGTANIFVTVAFSSHRQLAAGAGRLDVVNAVLIAQAVARIGGTVLVLQQWESVLAVAAVDLSVSVVGGAATWMVRRRVAPRTNSSVTEFSFAELRRLFSFSLDILVMTVAAVVILQSGVLLASLLLPLGAVAVYTAANRAYLLTREAANSLTVALLPVASRNSVSERTDANKTLFLAGTRLANCGLLLVLVPVLVFAEPLLRAWVGDSLAAGYIAAQVLMLSMLANNNHLIAVPILTGEGKIRPFARFHVIWALSGLGLAPLLAPSLGVVGIALALSVPVIVLEPLYVWVAIKALGVEWREFVTRCVFLPYAVAAPPALVLALIRPAVEGASSALFVTALAFWSVAMILIYWFLALTSAERVAIRRMLRLTRAD